MSEPIEIDLNPENPTDPDLDMNEKGVVVLTRGQVAVLKCLVRNNAARIAEELAKDKGLEGKEWRVQQMEIRAKNMKDLSIDLEAFVSLETLNRESPRVDGQTRIQRK
jgi:hypothetical protein